MSSYYSHAAEEEEAMFAAIGDPDEEPDESMEAVSAAEAAAEQCSKSAGAAGYSPEVAACAAKTADRMAVEIAIRSAKKAKKFKRKAAKYAKKAKKARERDWCAGFDQESLRVTASRLGYGYRMR